MRRIPHDIFERLERFHREVDERFRRVFEDQLDPSTLSDKAPHPPVDVFEGPDELVVRVDLPGVLRDDIELRGAPNFLILQGRKAPPSEKWTYLRVERTFGPFQRLVILPTPCDPSRIRAHFDQGLLEIQVPKLDDRRKEHRRVPIE